MEKIILIGAGGHSQSVIDSIKSKQHFEIVGITDSNYLTKTSILGCKVIGNDSVLKGLLDSGVKYAFITVGSVGDTVLKEKLCKMTKDIGYMHPVISDISAVIGSETFLGEGVYIGKKVVINASSSIGKYSIINTGAIIEHTCRIGDFTHVAPGTIVCGDVLIGSHTHIGANSVIIQGRIVGDNSLIGAGSVVTNDIPNNVIAYGNPCRVVKMNE